MTLMWFKPAEKAKRARVAAPVVMFASDKQRLYEIRRVDRGLYQAMIVDLLNKRTQSSIGFASIELAVSYCEQFATLEAEQAAATTVPSGATPASPTRRLATGQPKAQAKRTRKWAGETPPFLRDEVPAYGFGPRHGR